MSVHIPPVFFKVFLPLFLVIHPRGDEMSFAWQLQYMSLS